MRLEVFLQIAPQLTGVHVRTVSLYHFALLVHDELGEVPFDKVAQGPSLLFLHILPQRVRVRAVHIDLVEQVELYLKRGFLMNLQFPALILSSSEKEEFF